MTDIPVRPHRGIYVIPRFQLAKKRLARRWSRFAGNERLAADSSSSIREDLIALVRDGKAETRLTRRANAVLLLDDGMSCEAIAKVLYLDDDTIRYWYKLFGEKA